MAANLVLVSEASAGWRVRSVRMGAPGSAADIARPFDVPVLGVIAYSVTGAVIEPAYHVLKLVLCPTVCVAVMPNLVFSQYVRIGAVQCPVVGIFGRLFQNRSHSNG